MSKALLLASSNPGQRIGLEYAVRLDGVVFVRNWNFASRDRSAVWKPVGQTSYLADGIAQKMMAAEANALTIQHGSYLLRLNRAPKIRLP